jgi:hypothetical protein
MNYRNVLLKVLIVCFAISLTACKKQQKTESGFVPTKQQIAEDAIKAWMINSKEYPHYRAVVFGDLTPRYLRTNRTLQLTIQISEEEIHSQQTGNTQRLDSLKAIMERHKGDMLGYIIAHKFQEINIAGETINRELLFFLDTSLRIASVLNPESFDYILDEKVFFRLDSVPN